MSLSKRQRDRAVEIATQALMKTGLPPDRAEIAEKVEELLPKILGEPSMELREQPQRGIFRPDWQNAMFAETAVDLELLYAEDIDVLERLLSHLALAEVNGRRVNQELRALQDLLEDLLLTSVRGTNFFHTIFDSFIDLGKIDQVRSDAAADVATGIITLAPESSSRRLPLAHLIGQSSGNIEVIQPRQAAIRRVPESRFENAFEDLLTAWQFEVLTLQQEKVTVAINIPLVKVDITNPPAPVRISRIVLHSLSNTPYQVLPLWTKDGTAFSQFPNLSEPILIGDDVAVIDVVPTEATTLQLQITKNAPDGEDEIQLQSLARQIVGQVIQGALDIFEPFFAPFGGLPSVNLGQALPAQRVNVFTTTFGFRQISVWQMGFKRSGTLISKTLEPQDVDDLRTIAKVSLTVDEHVPIGTQIDYEVASNAEPETFVPISPINRPNDLAPQVVDFTKVQRADRESNRFTVDAGNPAVSLGTIRGTEFFAIKTVSDPAIFKTARLWRGENAWVCKRTTEAQIETVQNLLIDFADGDVQSLYLFEENERIGIHPTNAAGNTSIQIETRFPVLLASGSFNPSEDLRSPTDVTRPNYAIRQLVRRPVPGTIDQSGVTGSVVSVISRNQNGNAQSDIQPNSPTAGRAGAQVKITAFNTGSFLVTTSGNVEELFNMPFRLSYVQNSITLAGTFTILSAQLETDGTLVLQLDDPTDILETTQTAVSVAWEVLAVNVTGSITGVDGNKLTLARSQRINAADLLEISYRRALLPVETPLTASIVVKDSTTGSTVTVYQNGRDYTIDQGTRTISRITTGNITQSADGAGLAVRVDFQYESERLGLVSYRTYLFNSEPTPKLTISPITVDRENGEEILLETSQGFIDLNDRTSLPALSAGWHQIIVRSEPILRADGTVDTTSAIYKAIQLKEIRTTGDAGRFLLPAHEHPEATGVLVDKFAGYFTRQAAFLEPMKQVSFRELSVATRKTDRSVFAIKAASEAPVTGTAVVVTNFDPATSFTPQASIGRDLIYLPPDVAGSAVRPLAREDFALEYSFVPTDVIPLTGLKLRATLKRSPDTDGAVTPILRSYTLRLSF